MLNLLPQFKPSPEQKEGDGETGKHRQKRRGGGTGTKDWNPASSLALDNNIPAYLDVQPVSRGKINLPPKIDMAREMQMTLAPNERYTTVSDTYTNLDPSPLSHSQR